MSLDTHTYELDIPGLPFKVKGTSTLDTETKDMSAVFEVEGGGKVTVEFPDDRDTTERTDMLCQVLYRALAVQTMRVAEEVVTAAAFNQIVEGLE